MLQRTQRGFKNPTNGPMALRALSLPVNVLTSLCSQIYLQDCISRQVIIFLYFSRLEEKFSPKNSLVTSVCAWFVMASVHVCQTSKCFDNKQCVY